MNKELLERYRKYLTNAQVKELAAKAERYKLLNAQRRAEAQNSILAQRRQTRRGLQNVGLASREGKVISGMETARNDALTNAYATYNRQLRKVEDAQTQNAAARMVNANIAAQRRASEEAAREADAEAERVRKEYELAREQQRAQQIAKPNLWNVAVPDNGEQSTQNTAKQQALANEQYRAAAAQQRFASYDPSKHTDAENLQHYREEAKLAGLFGTAANQYAIDKAREAGQKKAEYRAEGRAMLMDPTGKNRERMQGEIGKVADYVNSPVHQFSVDYGVSMAALKRTDPTSAAQIEERVDYLYSYIDKYTSKWDRMIAQGGKEAETAKREKAKIDGSFALLAESTRVPAEYRNLYYMSDDEFDVAFGAEEKLYEDQLAEGRVIEGDFNARREAFEAGRDVNGQDIQRDATIRHMWYEKVKADRAAAQPANMLAQSVTISDRYKDKYPSDESSIPTIEYVYSNQKQLNWHPVNWANPADYKGSNWRAARDHGWSADDYAKKHDTNGSKYAALVNEWSYIGGRQANLYAQDKQTENIVLNAGEFIGTIFGGKINRNAAYEWFRNECVMTFNGEYETSGTSEQKEQMDAMLTLANLMTDEERARFNTLKNTIGGKDADEYFEYLYNNVLPQRFRQYITEYLGEEARDGGFLGRSVLSLGSVGTNLVQGVSKPLQTMFSKQTDPVAAQLSAAKGNTAQSMRGAIGSHYGEVGNFLYQTGMSMADSATVALISSGLGNVFSGALKGFGVGAEMAAKIGSKAGSVIGGSILGGSAFNSAYDEALQRGLSPEKARMTAFGNGVNEMLFESLSLDLLVSRFKTGDMLKVSKNGFVNWLVNTLVQGGVEGSEEVFTDMANNLWDKSVNKIYAEELTKLREYISQGKSYEEAKNLVSEEYGAQLWQSFLGGAISGGVMGGGATFIGMVQNRGNEKVGKGLRQNSRVMNELRNFDFKSEYAKEILQQKNLTNADVADLFNIRQQELLSQYKSDIQKAVADGSITQEQADLLKQYEQNGVQIVKDGKVIGNAEGITVEQMPSVHDAIAKLDNAAKIQFLNNEEMRSLVKAVGGETAAVIEQSETAEREAEKKYRQTVREINNDTTLSPELKQERLEAAERTRQNARSEASKIADTALTNKKGIGAKLETDGNGTVKVGKGSGKVTYDFSTKDNPGHQTVDSMTATEQSALRIAKVVAASRPDVNVKVEAEFGVDENGIDHSKENGYYDRSTNTIHINMSGDNSVLWTLSHELTHHLANTDTEAYAALRTAIETALKDSSLTTTELEDRGFEYDLDRVDPYIAREGNLWDALVAFEREEHGYGKDAEEEVVARCCESFLGFNQFVKDFAHKQYKSAKAVNKFIAQMNIDMQRVSEDARQSAAQRNVWNDESPENQILRQLTEIDRIANLWRIAVNAEAKKRQAAREETRASTKDVVKQEITSAKTSIKQIPALFTNSNVKFGKTNIDIGGGRFDLATNYLAERGTKNMIFDPYNRDEAYNTKTLKFLQDGNKADTATCANVLNVIAEKEARANVILEVAKSIKQDGKAYFMVYEGDGSGVGKQTSAGYQNNRKTADYVGEIGEYFDTVTRKGKLIIAEEPIANLPKASWEVSPGNGVRFSKKDSVKLSDAQYLDIARRYESGDKSVEAELRKALRNAARRNGYVLATYHGTSEYFNTFNMGVEGIHLGTEAVAKQVANIRYNNRSKQTTYEWKDLRGRIKEIGTETREEILKKAWTDADDYTDEGIEPYSGSVDDDESVVRYVDRVEKAVDRKHGYRLYLNTFDRNVGERIIPIYAKIDNPLVINGDLGYWTPFEIAETILDMAVGKSSRESLNGDPINITESEVKLTAAQKRALLNIDQLKRIRLTDEKFKQAWNELGNVLESMGFDGIKYRNEYEGNKNSYSYIALRPSDVKSAELVTKDDKGNIIPLSERFRTDRTGEDSWKNEDIRYSLKDKVRLFTSDGTRTYTLGDVTAKMYGNDVELDGGKVRQRVQMMEAIAEVYGTARVDAASEAEAEAFRRAGAEEVVEELEGHGAKYGTWEFKYEERKFTNDSRYDIKQKQKFAKDILKQVGKSNGFTQAQRVKYGAALGRLMDYLWEMQYGKMDGKVVFEFADRLFDSILNDYTALSEADEEFRSELLANMTKAKNAKGSTVYVLAVNDKQMREIKYAYENAMAYASKLSKALGARVTVKQTENAKTLEDIFTNSTDTRIKSDTNEGDMPSELLRLAQETESRKTNPYAAESEERQALKMGMFEAAMAAAGVEKSTAQQIREAVKTARAEERAKARKKIAERDAKLKKEFKATAAKREARMKQKFKETTARANETRLKRDMRTIALKWNQRLVKMLANPTEASHIPVQLAREVAELTKTITEYLDSGTERGRINLDKVIKAYQRSFADEETIAKAKAEDPRFDPRGLLPLHYDLNGNVIKEDPLLDMMNELNEIVASKSFKDLSAYEMKALLDIVRGVAKTVYDANRLIGQGERRAIFEVGDSMIHQFEDAPDVKLKGYLETSLDFRRLARIFSGSNDNAEFVKLVERLNDGAIEKGRIAQVLQGIFAPVTEKYGDEIRKWYGKKAEWIDTGITQNGKKAEITKGMRVSLAMHVLNAGNMNHIANGGITIPNREMYNKGKMTDAYANGETVQLSAEQIEEIISHMTEAEKAYVEAAKEFFHKRTGYYVNKTSLQLLGYRKATVENYFPIHTDKNFTKTDFASLQMDGSIEGQGFLKERVNASNPVYLEDITSVVNRQIRGVALYAGLAVPMRNFNAVMNSTEYFEDENGAWRPRTTVRKAMTQKMGEYGAKVVKGFLEDASEMTHVDVTPMERFAGKLATNYVKAVLLGNLKVAMKQVASYPTAAAVIPWKYLGKALLKGGRNGRVISRADVDLINQYTPLYQMRREGQANEIASIMAKRGMEQKLPWLLGWITKMDVMTVGRLWSAAEYMVADQQKNLPVGSDEYYKAVAKVFNDTIQQTQPNFTPLQRNAALRSKNPVVRSLVLFGTQRMQNGGILMEAAMELKQSKGKSKAEIKAAKMKLGRAVASQIVQNILLIVASLGVDALRGRMKGWQDEDKDITPESMMKGMGDMFLSNFIGSFLGGTETYSLISGLFKKAMGETAYDTEFTVPALDAVETLINFAQSDVPDAVKYLLGDHTDEEKQKRAINFSYQLAKAFGYATGIPLENALKDVCKGIIPAIEDIRDAVKTGELNPWLHQSGKLDKKTTNANYKEWTNDGKKGSVYLYWERVANDLPKEKDSGYPKSDMLSSKLMADRDLTPEEKATLYRMLGGDLVQEGSVVYHPLTVNQKYLKEKEHGTIAVDFTNYSRYQMSQMEDAKYNGFLKAVEMGVPEDLAATAYRNYASAKKYETKRGVDAKDSFHDWLFKMVSDPAQRAILDMQVVGSAKSVKGSIGYKENGDAYADYSSRDSFNAYTQGTKKTEKAEAVSNIEGTPQQKAEAFASMYGYTAKNGIVYNDKGVVQADYTSDEAYKASQMGDAHYEKYTAAVKGGMSRGNAIKAVEMHKQIDTAGGDDDAKRYREWVFKTFTNANDRAVAESLYITKELTIKNGRSYDENGYIYRDYTSVAWYKLSNRNLSKDGKNKRYETAQTLTKQGYTAEQVVATYVDLDKLSKKTEWKKYLKDHGFTDEQINLFLWSKGWAKLK